MNANDIVTIIFSSTLLATLVTSAFNLLINKRKDSIDNIVKERKTWRDELRVISSSISKSKNIIELKLAISELKVRINAYGIADNSIFKDSNIWEQIFVVESKDFFSAKELENIKRRFVNQISCLLKYDWERSKAEIKGSMQTRIVIISLIISYLLYSFRWFYYYNIGSGKIINFLSYTEVFILFSAFSMLMISFADKWKNAMQLRSFIVGSIAGMIFLYVFMYETLPNALPYDIFDWIIRLAPFITLIYAIELKLLTYRQNVKNFILSSTLSSGVTKINKKYKIFFDRKKYKELFKREGIVFDDFKELTILHIKESSYDKERALDEKRN